MSRAYWRSLEELEGSPESAEFRVREFPDGASEPPDEWTRRQMITLLGASLSLAGLAGCRRPVEAIVPYVNPPEQVIPGVPRRYATTMPFGRSAHGLVVESHEGRPTKIEGNELHPSTMGASSPRTQAAILGLYDPDRSRTVLHAGEPKSWADFVAAWGELAKSHLVDGGRGLAILSHSFASPTLARLRGDLLARFPSARWAVHEAVGDENTLAGIRAATGKELEPELDLAAARVILALDADLLATHPEGIRHTRGFAAGRRAGAEGGEMSRLYSVEAPYTLTGAMADHRWSLPARLVPAFVSSLAARLASMGLAIAHAPAAADGPIPGLDPKRIDALARDLLAHRGAGLVVAGPRQPPGVHAAVVALNDALGNVGATVRYREPVDAARPSLSSVTELVAAMRAGEIGTIVLLGANPVYDAPADWDFAAALAKVPNSIALGSHLDETGRLAAWHVPRAHFLESWGDARAVGGVASVVQPLILPLFGGRSDVELLGTLVFDRDVPGHELVRDTWQKLLGESDFERRWNRVLHDGLLAGSELPPVAVPVVADPFGGLERSIEADTIELVFEPSITLHDGRFANDGWLQELPDPITKITWDNPLLLSPGTARKLGVGNEDVVRVEAGGRSLELPVWIVPGQADGTAVATLGQGRRSAGRVGDGVGFDTYRLRPSDALHLQVGATLVRTGSTHPLGTTQEHGSMEGRPIVREGKVEEFRRDPASLHERGHGPGLFSLWEEQRYDSGHQWGMTIDLNSCVGCNACAVACQSENNVPIVGKEQVRRGREMHWIRVDRYFAGEGEPTQEDPEIVFQPVPCMHCENAPCEQVCPVAATVHDAEGLNAMVYNRCIGTRYCSNNCPYKVRRFNFFNYTKDTPESLKLANNPDVTVRSRGVMEKCTYCVQRINAVKIDVRVSGRTLRDGDVQTACQQACPAGAIVFGDLRDPDSRVRKLKADSRSYALLEELNAKPRTTYLAKLRNPNPELG